MPSDFQLPPPTPQTGSVAETNQTNQPAKTQQTGHLGSAHTAKLSRPQGKTPRPTAQNPHINNVFIGKKYFHIQNTKQKKEALDTKETAKKFDAPYLHWKKDSKPQIAEKSAIVIGDARNDAQKIHSNSKHKNIYNEIFTSEKSYNEGLKDFSKDLNRLINHPKIDIFIKNYNNNLKDPSKRIELKDIVKCINNIDKLTIASDKVLSFDKKYSENPLAVYRDFLTNGSQAILDAMGPLAEYTSTNNWEITGDFFNHVISSDKAYNEEYHGKLGKNKKVIGFSEGKISKLLPGASLILPAQRMAKYPLLLAELAKLDQPTGINVTDISNQVKEKVDIANKRRGEFDSIQNVKRREFESIQKLYEKFPEHLSKDPIKSLYTLYSENKNDKNNALYFEGAVNKAKTLTKERYNLKDKKDITIISGMNEQTRNEIKQFNDFEKIRSELENFIKSLKLQGKEDEFIYKKLMDKFGIEASKPPENTEETTRIFDEFKQFIDILLTKPKLV